MFEANSNSGVGNDQPAPTVVSPYLIAPEAAAYLQPETHVHQLEQKLRNFFHPSDIPVRYLLRDGDPVAEIWKVASDEHCDVIVLGSHGRRGLSHLLMGSVAERMVRAAPCPVLVVKRPPTTEATVRACG